MFYSNLKYVDQYPFLPEAFQKVWAYIRETDMGSLENGSYEIEGKDIFVNIASYTSMTREERNFWEAHKEYVDVHYIIAGEEIIDVKLLDHVKTGEYKEESDFLAIEARGGSAVHMHEKDVLILYPEEAHQTAVRVEEPTFVKKAIFKVRLSLV